MKWSENLNKWFSFGMTFCPVFENTIYKCNKTGQNDPVFICHKNTGTFKNLTCFHNLKTSGPHCNLINRYENVKQLHPFRLQSICLFVNLSVCPFVCLLVHLSVCLFILLLSMCLLSICLSICPSSPLPCLSKFFE